MEKTVKIDGMKCDGCVQAVTEKFSGIDGVTNVAVHLADQTAIVTADREVSQGCQRITKNRAYHHE